MQMETIWHYTSMEHAKLIFKDKLLKVSWVEKKWGWKPSLWFDRSTVWEPSATKMMRFKDRNEVRLLTDEEQFKLIGMARFGIGFSDHLISWYAYKNFNVIPVQEYKEITKIAKEKGAHPSNWFCSFEDIPLRKCIAIEQFDGEKWFSIINTAL
jgi:hypothetical protein